MEYIADDYAYIRERMDQIRKQERDWMKTRPKFVIPIEVFADQWAWHWLKDNFQLLAPYKQPTDDARGQSDFCPCPYKLKDFLTWVRRNEPTREAARPFRVGISMDDRIINVKILLCRLAALDMIERS
jgi:hypothetical protein